MKKVFFVSTGRCGTTRLAEILRACLSEEEYSVIHQMNVSRMANILGNLMYYFGQNEWLKEKVHNYILKKYACNNTFICTDPLISMTIPKSLVHDSETHIIQIIRNKDDFTESFYRFSRKRIMSFIAHNFIPFWQLGIWPFENILNSRIKSKYIKVWKIKNEWLKINYSVNQNFSIISMNDLFLVNQFKDILDFHLNVKPDISQEELKIKSNKSS